MTVEQCIPLRGMRAGWSAYVAVLDSILNSSYLLKVAVIALGMQLMIICIQCTHPNHSI